MSGLFKRKKKQVDPGPDTSSAIYQEQQLQNQKAAARQQLNKVFGYGDPAAMANRDRLYGTYTGAARDLNKKYLDEERKDAAEALSIQLARQGLGGSSTDIEQNSKINRAYNEGLVDIGNRTDEMARALKGQDEQTRLQLLSAIDQGMDSGTSLNIAHSKLNEGVNNAIAQSRGRFVGNQFANLFGGAGQMAFTAGADSARGTMPMPMQGPSGYMPIAGRRPRTISWGT